MNEISLYLCIDNQVSGPLSAFGIRHQIKKGKINWETLAAEEGMDEWLPLSTWADVIEPAASPPPPPLTAEAIAVAINEVQAAAMKKSARTTGLAAMAIGMLNPQLGDSMLGAAAAQGQMARNLKKK